MNKKIILLWGLFIFLIGVSIITNEYYNSGNSEGRATKNDIIEENQNDFKLIPPKKSAYAHYREWIHIDGSDPNNWSDTAAAYDWCYVENNYYVIENVTIDATNSPLSRGTGILIENSLNEYFIIRNCTIANSSASVSDGTITLEDTNNGTIIDNKLIDNQNGIVLDNASNNTIVNNTIESKEYAIYILGGAPSFFECYDNYLSNNSMSNCGITMGGTLEELMSNTIETSNTVNEKPVYYYVNKSGLMPINFTNAGQIILYYSNHSQISNINISYGSSGISILNCWNITLTNSNSSYNNRNGITIYNSQNVTLSNSWIIGNGDIGLYLYNSEHCNASFNYYIDNEIGITLRGSPDNVIKNNTMIQCGIFLRDTTPPLASYTIDTSNTVNGKPIYYYKNKNNLDIANFTNPGQIILDNCNDSVISDFDLSQGSYGVLIFFSQNVSIINNNVSFSKEIGIKILSSDNITLTYNDAEHCEIGIRFESGKDNNISYNSASYNDDAGAYLDFIEDTIFYNNNITHNRNSGDNSGGLTLDTCTNVNITDSLFFKNTLDGIYLSDCSSLLLENNIIINNSDGLFFRRTDFCTVKSNIISNNTRYGVFIYDAVVFDNVIYNNTFIGNQYHAFDDGINNHWNSSIIGNYWDNYTGEDLIAPYGIGDTPYNIPGAAGSKDYLPITNETLPIPEPTPEPTGPPFGGDDDDDNGGNGDEEAIFGYDIIAIIALISCVTVVLIKKWYEQIKN